MQIHTICILGGTGFVGHSLAEKLGSSGHQVRILTRRPERHRDLAVNPGITLARGNAHDPQVLRQQFAGCDTVINLVGILNESGRAHFQDCHVELVRKINTAATDCKVRRLLHMSALNASAQVTRGNYLRSKGEGEDLAHSAADAGIAVTSFRPSVIFGPQDSFFNRFAALLRLTPLAFPLACAGTRFAPVHVADVAEAFARALDDKATFGKRLELCGPRIYTLQQLVEYTAATLGLRRRIIALPDAVARLQARLLEYAPGKPFTMDNYYSLQHDSVCHKPGWSLLGISPAPVEAVVPLYLGQANRCARYDRYRRQARHN